MSRQSHLQDDSGAIIPIFALLIVVLLVFAAFTVDLGAAWAERRSAQTTADASVMAAALEYLRTTAPTEEKTVSLVIEYANLNSRAPVANWEDLIQEWDDCTETPPTGFAPIVANVAGTGTRTYDCISLKNTAGEPTLLRVRVPDTLVETSFARLINVNTIAVSAYAVAEIRNQESQPIMPFSLPADNATGEEQCLATPPSGLLPGDVTPCDGPVQGNFGLLDSPFFGANKPHYTMPTSCTTGGNPNFNTRAPHNLAIGLDHVVISWASSDPLPADGSNVGNNHEGADDCSTAIDDNAPYVLLTQPGNTQSAGGKALLQNGFLGDDPSPTPANLPGRLRQDSQTAPPAVVGLSAPARFTMTTNTRSLSVDNVALWEYLDQSAIDSNSPCYSTAFAATSTQTGNALTGRELTDQLLACLSTNNPNHEPMFIDELIHSPRFVIVPVLNYNEGDQFGNKWWAVKEMKPVFLQSTWYQCSAGGDKNCYFQPNDFDLTHGGGQAYSLLYNPGEGSAPMEDSSGGVPNNSKFQIMGVSGLILDWDWLDPEVKNQIGEPVPLSVYLYE